jgi:hypothetical protein
MQCAENRVLPTCTLSAHDKIIKVSNKLFLTQNKFPHLPFWLKKCVKNTFKCSKVKYLIYIVPLVAGDNLNHGELNAIASEPVSSHLFTVKDFQTLLAAEQGVVNKTCDGRRFTHIVFFFPFLIILTQWVANADWDWTVLLITAAGLSG